MSRTVAVAKSAENPRQSALRSHFAWGHGCLAGERLHIHAVALSLVAARRTTRAKRVVQAWPILLASVVGLPWCASLSAGIIAVDMAPFDKEGVETSKAKRAGTPSPSMRPTRPAPDSTSFEVKPAESKLSGQKPDETNSGRAFSVLPMLNMSPDVQADFEASIELYPGQFAERRRQLNGNNLGSSDERTATALAVASPTNEQPDGGPAGRFFILVLTSCGVVAIVAACGAFYRKRRDAHRDDDAQATFEYGMNSAWARREMRRIHTGEASASLRFLGLDESATETEVLAAYRQLAFRAHPDRNGDSRAFKTLHGHFERALSQVRSRNREKT